MPLGDLIEEAARRLFVEIVGAILEVPVRGLGYVILRYGVYLGRREVKWESHAVLVVGVLSWLVIGIVGYKVWSAYRYES